MKKAIIIGAGVTGVSCAYVLKKLGFNVKLLEAAPSAGGGVWTRFHGGHPYTFGPRIFFTPDDEVISFTQNLIKIREFDTITWTYVEEDDALYHYPLQYSDIEQMPDAQTINDQLKTIEKEKNKISSQNFEAYWISAIGKNLYGKFVDDYSKKMWGIEDNRQLSANFEWVNRGIPIRDGDIRLYQDQFQGYPEPLDGFNSFFGKCLEGIDVDYNRPVTKIDPETSTIYTKDGEKHTADIVVNTVIVDFLFDNVFGELKHIGRDFFPVWLPVKYAMPEDVTWIHYSGKEAYTRVTEFKKITNYDSEHTLLGIEVPSNRGRYYPVQSQPEITRYNQYKELFPNNFYSLGRLGKFKYQGIPDGIRDALDLKEKLQ